MALKIGRGSPLAKRNGFNEDGGFKILPLRVESHEKDGCSMGSGGKDRIEEKEKDTRAN